MEMTVSPQDGTRCNDNDQENSRLERQLEWSRRIGINELKRIYGASLFLRCTSYLFFVLAMLSFCGTVSIVLAEKIPELRLYPEWTLPLPVILIAAQYLKKLKIPFLCRKIISVLQIGLVIAVGSFFFEFVIRNLIIYPYKLFISSFWSWGHHCRPVLICISLFILLKMGFDVLWNGRSRQIRIGLIVLSLSWGIIGWIFLPPAYAVIFCVLMVGIIWITVFSKIRYQLFRDDALSHNQLYAVLEQKKRNIPDEELTVPEDRRDISRRKFRLGAALYFLSVLIVAALWILSAPGYKWFLRITAELGYVDAQFRLAQGYSYGLGVERNDAKSVKWYRKAAEQGFAEAQFNLGVCYASGRGVRPDYTEACKWYRKYVDHKNAELGKEFHPITALKLAETYIILGEYDRAISYLDDPRLQQDHQYGSRIPCLRTYLKACALLAKGNNAEAEIRQINTYLLGNLMYSAWDVTAFRLWLERANLSDQARKTISELTDRVARSR